MATPATAATIRSLFMLRCIPKLVVQSTYGHFVFAPLRPGHREFTRLEPLHDLPTALLAPGYFAFSVA